MRAIQRGARALYKSAAVLDSFTPTALGETSSLESARRCFVSAASLAQSPVHLEDERFCRQRSHVVLGMRSPEYAADTWIAPNAVIVGDVDLYDKVSIWYGCVLRGDLNTIHISFCSNIQDKTVIHAARTSPTGLSAQTRIGMYVSVGQACVLRSTTIEDECIIGNKCVLMEGSLVEKNSILAPGTVVAPGRLIPSGQLWSGNPARFVRDLTRDEKADILRVAEDVVHFYDKNRAEQQLPSFQYIHAERIRDALAEGEKAAQVRQEEAPQTSTEKEDVRGSQ